MLIVFSQGNILVGEDMTAKLTDFGLSLVSDGIAGANYSVHGGGAVPYKAPEFWAAEEQYHSFRPTHESYIYSFAYVCFEVRMLHHHAAIFH